MIKTKYQIEYRQLSYSCHQRRLSEIINRKKSNDQNYIKLIDSSRRNKFLDSRRKDLIKQQEILSENDRLLKKIVNIKCSYYCSLSSRQSLSSDCTKQSARSIEQKQINVQRIKDNYLRKQKISQIQSTYKTIKIERTTRDQFEKPIYNLEEIENKKECVQIHKTSENRKVDISKTEKMRIVNTLPEIKNRNYKIIARSLKDKLYNN